MGIIFIFISSAIFITCLIALSLSQRIKALNKKFKELEKEVEIKNNTLNYEKKQYLESNNYLHSIIIIIMDLVSQISSVLNREKDTLEEDILAAVFERIKTLLKPKKCILFKVSQKDNSLLPALFFGYGEEELKNLNISTGESGGLAGWSVATARFISVYDAQQDPALRHLADRERFQCDYFQPIKVDNQVRALIGVGKIEEKIDALVLNRLFSILSNICAVALRDANFTQQLRHQSICDGLTGLYNHSYFQKWLEDLLYRPFKEEQTLILAMVDLDNFKKINDTYGHLVGDNVLKSITGLLGSLNIPEYICARYGGEEFILGFLGKELDDISLMMEKLRQDVAKQIFRANGNTFGVTVSIGITEAKLKADKHLNRSELIEQADKALYKAKFTGKNKIVIAED